MLGCLVHIDGYDPVAATAVTLYASSVDDPNVCHLNGQTWWPTISQLPALRYDLFSGAFDGRIDTPGTSISLSIEPWPNFPRYVLADARVRLWTGNVGDAWGSWTLRFDGRATAQPRIVDGIATLQIAVDDRWLDTPVLSTYAGTTGAEGPAALKGTPKPLALGAPRYAPGVLIDPTNNVVQISSYGLIEDVEFALERLASFGASTGDHASYAALVAASIPAGRWATAEAVGMVRHGAPPVGRLSYQVKGDKAGTDGWARKPGQLARRIAILAGGTGKIDDASLNALDVARPWNLSIMVTQQTTARELIQKIAASVNAVMGVSWLGKLFIAPIAIAGSAVATLKADGSALPPVASVTPVEIGPPWWRIDMKAEQTWSVHSFDEVAFGVTLVDRGRYAAGTTYREGDVVDLEDGSRYRYINPTPTAGNAPPNGTYWAQMTPPLVYADITDAPGSLADLDPTRETDIENILDKDVLSRAAKPHWVSLYEEYAADYTAAILKSQRYLNNPTLDGLRTTVTTEKSDLDAYLATISPAWNDLTQDSALPGGFNTFKANFTSATTTLGQLKVLMGMYNPSPVSRVNSMGYATAAAFDDAWGTAGQSGERAIVTTTDMGGKAVKLGNNSGNDEVAAFDDEWTAYSPEDLYQVAFDVDVGTSGASAILYMGVQAMNNAGANLPGDFGTYCHVAGGLNQAANTGRKTYYGYFRGRAAVGGSNNVGSPTNSIDTPTPMPNNTVKVRAFLIANSAGQPGQVTVHGVELRKLDDATVRHTGGWVSTRTYARNEGVTYQGRQFGSKANGNLNHTPPSSFTSDTYWYAIQEVPARIKLSATAEAFRYVNDAADPSSQSITITATLVNMTGTVSWSSSPSVTLTGSGNSRSLAIADFGSNSEVEITATLAGVSESIKITRKEVTGDIVLNASKANFTFVDNVANPGSQSITITGSRKNVAGAFTWSTTPTVTLTGSGDSRSLAIADFGANTEVEITATIGSVSRSIKIARSNRSTAQAGADVTKDYAPGITGPSAIIFTSGVGGRRVFSFTRKEGDTDVTTSTGWTVASNPGVNYWLLNYNTGKIEIYGINASLPDGTTLKLSSKYPNDASGITYDFDVALFIRKLLPAVSSSTLRRVKYTSATLTTSTTLTTVTASQVTVTTGANGAAQLVAGIHFHVEDDYVTALPNAVSDGGSLNIYGKWQYKQTSSGTWIDAAAEAEANYPNLVVSHGTHTAQPMGLSRAFFDNNPGYLDIEIALTGLTASTSYDFRFQMRRDGPSTNESAGYSGNTEVSVS